jgi:hypothetical protein
MLLAAFVEHTTDVDGMLDSMHPEQFKEWELFFEMLLRSIGQLLEAPDRPSSLQLMRQMAGV